MIKNERQFRITKAEADRFQQAIKELEAAGPAKGVHRLLHGAQVDALRSQLTDLRTELKEYESLQSGTTGILHVTSLANLPTALIKARIAAGLTQEELASRVGLKEQQIQRYEATDYKSASLTRVAQVIHAPNVDIQIELSTPGQMSPPGL